MGPPDTVNEVALARAPVPLRAIPVRGPVIVMIGLPLFPEKVMLPLVGADNVTDEFDALAVIEPNATARIKATEITKTFRMFEALPGKSCRGRAGVLGNRSHTQRAKRSIHKTIVNSTTVLELNSCPFG
jgi:hypothetical protein